MTTVPGGDRSLETGSDGPPGVSVLEWRRYGHHRAYAALPDGTKLGFRCLATGVDHPVDPSYAVALGRAVDAWVSGPSAPTDDPVTPLLPVAPGPPASLVSRPVGPPTTVTPARATSPAPTAVPTPPATTRAVPEPIEIRPVATPRVVVPLTWNDLALNEPGAAPRAKARARRQASPGRSAVGRMLGVHTQERAWRVGARGEQLVAAALAKLAKQDPRWRVLHSVPVGTGAADIDHVVVGPGGVFTLNTEYHAGKRMWVGGDTVMVNGRRVPYVRHARHEARRATRLLSLATGVDVEVTGMVVPAKLLELVVEAPPVDVVVLHRSALARWLAERPPVLGDHRIELIHSQARRSSTWER